MSPRKKQCSAQLRARAKVGVMLVILLLCGDIEINRTPDPITSTHVVFVANLCDVTRKELNVRNVNYGTTHATLV